MYVQDIDAEIIIIGSGIAGLTAAYTLLEREPTLTVLILEKNDRTGGRILSVPLKTGTNSFCTIDAGAEFILKDQTELLTLLQKIGVQTKRFDRPNGSSIFALGGRNIFIPNGSNIFTNLSAKQRLQFAKFIVNIETLCKNIKYNLSPEAIAQLSLESLEEYANKVVDRSKATMDIIRHVILTNIGVPPSEISVLFYIFYCISHKGLENQLLSLKGRENHFSFVNGAQTICDKIIDNIGRYTLIKNEEVVQIKSFQHFLEIFTKKRSYTCYSIIVATPPISFLNITFTPPLENEKFRAVSKTNMGITTSFIITYPQNYWEIMGYSGTVHFLDECMILPNVVLLYFCNTSHQSKFVISGKVFEYGNIRPKTPTCYKDVILDELCRFFGEECRNPTDYFEYCWKEECGKMFTWDMGVVNYIDRVTSSSHRIYWAGAETSSNWYGSLAGAVHSGIRAALQALYDRRPSALNSNDIEIIKPALRRRMQLQEFNEDPLYKTFVHWKYYTLLLAAVVFIIWRVKKYRYG